MVYLTGLLAVCLAYVHTLGGRLRIFNVVPRSTWLSMAGGASVAYVFVYILPDLSVHQKAFENTSFVGARDIPSHVYLLALVGLTAFYGLERTAKSARIRNRNAGRGDHAGAVVFWVHISSFALYNFLVGYLLVHREMPGLESLFLYFIAMALHFTVNDFGLWMDHKHAYRDTGRWILAGAVIVGWAVGSVTQIHELALACLFSFLAGGVLLNVLREELPEDRESRFWAFALGAALYSALLLLT